MSFQDMYGETICFEKEAWEEHSRISMDKQNHVLHMMYTVHPNNIECYYLYLLLHEVRGPMFFTDLRVVSASLL